MTTTGGSVLVVGGGPAGVTAALQASELGARVTLLEAAQVGGTSLNSARRRRSTMPSSASPATTICCGPSPTAVPTVSASSSPTARPASFWAPTSSANTRRKPCRPSRRAWPPARGWSRWPSSSSPTPPLPKRSAWPPRRSAGRSASEASRKPGAISGQKSDRNAERVRLNPRVRGRGTAPPPPGTGLRTATRRQPERRTWRA
jgi:hypothetical protein